jgi:PadR family transcriptional regulator PadR
VTLSRVTPATLDVLETLIGPDEELYGLRIAQNAGRKVGSVYPILARLEEAGWVESFWESEERHDRGGLAAARALLMEHRGCVRQRTGRTVRVRGLDPVTEFEPPRWTA